MCPLAVNQKISILLTRTNGAARAAVGLDMGIAYFLTDSNGCFVENPRHTKKYEKRLRVKNRALARKKEGSGRFRKTKSELKQLHSKIANVRKDFLHKNSFQYVKENSLIVCEERSAAAVKS